MHVELREIHEQQNRRLARRAERQLDIHPKKALPEPDDAMPQFFP